MGKGLLTGTIILLAVGLWSVLRFAGAPAPAVDKVDLIPAHAPPSAPRQDIQTDHSGSTATTTVIYGNAIYCTPSGMASGICSPDGIPISSSPTGNTAWTGNLPPNIVVHDGTTWTIDPQP